jgi:hypothetical protein
MKWFHNEKLSVAWAILVEIVVHLLFAFQAFLLGGFLGEVALTQVFGPAGVAIGAWGLALFIFGSAFQAFVLGEYMKDHVESYEATEKGDGSFMRSFWHVRWTVAGLEVASLAFRCIIVVQQGDIKQAIVVSVFGLLLLYYAFAQAKVIHASVNRPAAYDMEQAQQTVGKSLSTDSLKYIDDMTPQQKARFYSGDTSALQEAAVERLTAKQIKEQNKELANERRQNKRAQKEQEAADKLQRRQENAERGRDAAARLLDPSTWKVGTTRPKDNEDFLEAQMNGQANHLSQNGKRN